MIDVPVTVWQLQSESRRVNTQTLSEDKLSNWDKVSVQIWLKKKSSRLNIEPFYMKPTSFALALNMEQIKDQKFIPQKPLVANQEQSFHKAIADWT